MATMATQAHRTMRPTTAARTAAGTAPRGSPARRLAAAPGRG
jgi:hypothetical protein